jgi:hypothetical protein
MSVTDPSQFLSVSDYYQPHILKVFQRSRPLNTITIGNKDTCCVIRKVGCSEWPAFFFAERQQARTGSCTSHPGKIRSEILH